MIYGEKVKDARKSKNLTQEQLAEKVGVSRQTISLIEAGKYNPSLKVCIDLSLALDKSLDELFWAGDKLQQLMTFNNVLITDVGSTTTKGLLLGKDGSEFKFLAEVDVPTTVEKPYEDVKIGVINTAKALEEKTGITLVSKKDKLNVPYLTTSSAGGGLQILVFGLSSFETGKAAELTAYGAGGVILRTFTIDDRIPAIHKMRLIRDLHPDMILMAGGVDGGNISSVVRLSEILSLANPTPKFQQSEKLPLVFCGNKDAQSFVNNVLEDNFEVHLVDNIRPDFENLNTEPAKEKVHELFMTNVMERAPGYSELGKWVKEDIIPTPAGVERILTFYGENHKKNVLMVDMGGATTDIFSNIYGEYSRTVSANIGMSYSISNILANIDIDDLMKNLPKTISEDDVRNYISNKMLNPIYIPNSESEIMIEHSAAMNGISISWKQHQDMNFEVQKMGILDKLRRRDDVDPFQEVFKGIATDKIFQISDIDLIIGAGGVLSHTQTPEEALKILVEGFQPTGIVKIAIDKNFKSPHMGVLSTLNETVAMDLFINECLAEIGYVVAPTGEFDPDETVLKIMNKNSDVSYSLKGGEVLYLPNGGEFRLIPKNDARLYKNMSELELDSDLPILFDCRGRGKNFVGKPLSQYQIGEFYYDEVEFSTEVQKSSPAMEEGEYRFQRELPYEGEIFVKEGDSVSPETVIGENRFTPPKLYIIDIRRLVGYDKDLSQEEIEEGLLVDVGDEVGMQQKIFRKSGFLGHENYKSPVRGKVMRIEENGLIVLREIQDYSVKPTKINVAKKLAIKPKQIKGYLKVSVGDFVQRDQMLTKLSQEHYPVKAPSTGTVKDIDTDDGTVTIQYDIEPIELRAFVAGTVEKIRENFWAEIVGNGTIIYGIIGFGHENYGDIVWVDEDFDWETADGNILVTAAPIHAEFLKNAKQYNVSGIIAPSMNNSDWVNFYGQEIGVALTGDEDIPFTVILTEGFGQLQMNQNYREFFQKSVGKKASLSGRTQIRAGVTRPMVIIGK